MFLAGHGTVSGGVLVDSGRFDWDRAHAASGRFAELALSAGLDHGSGIRRGRGHRAVEATAASREVASSLGIPEGAPVLVLRSVSYDDRDVPVESFVAFHRGDRSRFEVELTRAESSPAMRPQMVVTGGEALESADS